MHSLLRTTMMAGAAGLLAAVAPTAARANPLGANVVGGTAAVQGQGSSQVIVNQSSQRAIINWNTFNIAPGETTRFIQPGASAVALNRVTGGLGASQIYGTITANGGIYIINPDGILFGAGAVINTGSFLATTHDIANSSFMAGSNAFTIPGNPAASIVNQGAITAAKGGFAALVAPGVRNDGIIAAKLGTVALASANGFTLDFYGDSLIKLQPGDAISASVRDVATGRPLASLVQNTGTLKANGGSVQLTAAAARQVVDSVINSSGVVEANSVGSRAGKVIFGAATGATKPAGAAAQVVKVSGRVSAAGRRSNTTGGLVQITGEDIRLAAAKIDASGQAGGGTVLIGGDAGGGAVNPAVAGFEPATLQSWPVATATAVTVDAATVIDASARATGNGGKVVLWSNALTSFAGLIKATGGALGGNGGFVETSGHVVAISGRVDGGKGGLWLLDPDDLIINSALAGTIGGTLNGGTSVIEQTTAAGIGGTGEITVSDAISWNSGASLTLSAYRDIFVYANITNTGGGAPVTLRADNTGSGTGTVSFYPGTHISTAGPVSIFYNPSVNPAGSVVNSTSYVSPTENYSANVTGGGQLTAYMLVNTVYDLQNMQNNLSATYALGANIDAGVTSGWNGGAGFVPIGNGWLTGFLGTFNGQGNTISNLVINLPTNTSAGDYAGLFGYVGVPGVVTKVGLIGGSVTGENNVGGLVGSNYGTVSQSYTTGTVSGSSVVGGLIGSNDGAVTNAHATGKVTGTSGSSFFDVGGLMGGNFDGTVSDVYATGAVSGGSHVGGLIGQNNGTVPGGNATVTNAYATGAVTGLSFVGGLIGNNGGNSLGMQLSGTATNVYATGTVTGGGGSGSVGGLMGGNFNSNVTNAYATGAVSGFNGVGGMVGTNDNSTVTQSYATGAVNGTTNVGGLIGSNFRSGTVTQSHATGEVIATGNNVGGLVGSNNTASLTLSYATGAVSGSASNVGGLVGLNQNSATVTGSYATGAVSGTGGSSFSSVGGLVGSNQSSATVTQSHATGAVTSNTNGVGGLVGSSNSATVMQSFATGAVTATGGFVNSGGLVGGLVGGNNAGSSISNSYSTGAVTSTVPFTGGLAGMNYGTIILSYATGAVSGVRGVGGLVANNFGTITQSYATGAVTGGAAVGGLAGTNDVGATISNSTASGSVTAIATGFTPTAGGFVGNNGGTISQSQSSGAVNGTSGSYLGGFAGINLGSIINSTAAASASVTGSGANNVAGGFVGANFGSIDPSSAAGAVTSGANSYVGGFAGINGGFVNFSSGYIPGSSFPNGTITNSTATGAVSGGAGSAVGAFIAVTNPSALPPGPYNNPGCIVVACQIMDAGVLPAASDTTSITPQVPIQIIIAPTTQNIGTTPPPTLITLAPPTNSGAPQGGSPGGGLPGGGSHSGSPPPPPSPGPPPGAGIGRTLSEQQLSGVPPLNETRFFPNEVVVQIQNTVPLAELELVARELGLTLITSQNLDGTARVMFRFRSADATDIRQLIRRLERRRIIASAQPNYVFALAQAAAPAAADDAKVAPPASELQSDLANSDLADSDLANSDLASRPALPAGDAAQYVIDKLHLGAIHQRVRGRNVTVAVIDSEIDARHPDLAGVIAEQFDATAGTSRPHPHGTGMAGAIASRSRLLGIAPAVRILAIKAFDESAASAEATTYQILKGLDHAIAQNARVVNMSFAGPYDPMMTRTLKTAYDRGIVLVAAAGNAGPKSPPLYPGADPSVIAVTATDSGDKPFAMANRGAYIAVAAPGVDVMVPAPNASYQLTTGTSVAAAHVSGVAALLIEGKPTITPAELRAALMRTARTISVRANDNQTGAGLVDPVGALQVLAPGPAAGRGAAGPTVH